MDATASVSNRFDAHTNSLWLADIVTIALLIGFVVLIYVLEQFLTPQFGPTALAAAGIVMALIPALLWLWFFYRRDAAEPEPRGMVLGVFVLGALVAAAVGIPLVHSVFQVNAWMYANQPWSYVAAAILVIGFAQQFLVYASVRFSVFNSAEFDGPTDGIIYATAVGLGYATVLNVRFITGDGATSLTLAAIQIVLTTLALASFAGIVGYFLGREKHEKRPLWWMTGGLVVAAALNGLFLVLRGQLTGGTSSSTPANQWLSLALAATLAIGTALVLSWLIRRDVRLAMAADGVEEDEERTVGQTRSSTLLVVLVTMLALGAGWLLGANALDRTRPIAQSGITLDVPASWLALPGADNVLLAANNIRRPQQRVSVRALPAADSPSGAAAVDVLNRARGMNSFRVLEQGMVEMDGVPVYRVHYAYVTAPLNAKPSVIEGVDYYMVVNGQLLVASFEDSSESFADSLSTFERMAATLRVADPGA